MNHRTARYKDAGVDIDAGNRAVAQMIPAIRATHTPQVLADIGSFGGLFALENLPAAPVLVASIDGVGTKVKLAAQAAALGVTPAPQVWRGIGQDLVNHCINDILVQNARPLFFLDYVAAARLEPDIVATVVTGMAEACGAAGCALLGGETAEMPGVYAEGALDVAGVIVGIVGRGDILPTPDTMAPGDLLVGLPSSGPHTNGYSLIRRALARQYHTEFAPDQKAATDVELAPAQLQAPLTATGGPRLIDALLAPHRSYLPEIRRLAEAGLLPKGLAHITGGGFVDNLPRILPQGLAAAVDAAAWSPPAVFAHILHWGQLDETEAYRVFNMGIGMVRVVAQAQLAALQARLPEAIVIGELVPRAEQAPGCAVERRT